MRNMCVFVCLAISGWWAAGCTKKEGGVELWKKACAHAINIAEKPAATADKKKRMESNCLKAFKRMKTSVADKTARCILKKKTEKGLEPCAPKSVRTRVANREAKLKTRYFLSRYQMILVSQAVKTGQYPATLEEAKIKVKPDGWGNPFSYKVKKDGFRLCSNGQDGIAGTKDDDCVTDK